jgi:hypothetical protein
MTDKGVSMKFLYNLFFITILSFNNLTAQVTGLSGWNIFLDPGHSQNENVGIYGYSEAKKVLRVGLYLRDLLLSKTDIDTVYISRTNDQQEVSLTQRTDYANSVGAAWYHSIHSDAGSPEVNSTLLLYGQYGNGQEKIPNGGKEMSGIMIPILTAGYRIPTRGPWGDHDFYGVCPSTHPCPYLWVNYATNMPSELSEAGFHTNPRQNQLNMNAKWKRLEAYTLFWSILKYFKIDRPFAGITTGIISDIESGQPINGAVITLNGQADTTDTYQSLFHLYSNDPDQLHNGFYFFENLPHGTLPITVSAEGYEAYSDNVAVVDTFFTFKDIKMISKTPPFITSISPVEGDSLYPGIDNINIIFSRPMDRTSVESTLVITPSVNLSYTWSDGDRKVSIKTSGLEFNTNYQLTISGKAMDKYNHPFDGDTNGTGGDDFVLNFKTKTQDLTPPKIIYSYPPENETGVELQPIIALNFDEQINTSTLSGKYRIVRNSDQSNVVIIPKHYIVNNKSVINFFIKDPLEINEKYTVEIDPGAKDIFGNEITDQFSNQFTTGDQEYSNVSYIDNFENGIGNWWAPQQSGSTVGIISQATGISNDASYFNYIYGGSKSMKLTYGWDTTASDWLIREYYSPASPSFTSSNILQMYLFGDAGGNKLRFAVKDNTGTVEVSPWYTINWAGWKLINWDMTKDGTGSWIGNGVLDNPLKFDSFQLSYNPGGNTAGELYFDDLRIVNETTVGIKEENNSSIPTSYILEQNYPNPFNPTTQISFGIPRSGFVKLEVYNLLGQKISTLVNQEMSSGYHSINFSAKGADGKDLSSGIYIYTLSANGFVTSRKMILLK